MNRNLIVGLAALALVLSAPAVAGNDNANPCGNNGNNCNPSQPSSATAGAAAGAVAGAAAISGAYAEGGSANSVALGGNVGDIRNTNTAFGGAGGQGGDSTAIAVGGQGGRGGDGGNAFQGQGQNQGQGQGQDQSQSNFGVNSQGQSSKNTNIVGQTTDASSQNDNRSSANGNATTVGGQQVNISTHVQAKRNAPSISGGTVFPTASCKGGFGIGGSGPAGGGLLNIATTDRECQTVLLGDHFAAIGMPETACDLYKTTKTWERALAKNPNIRAVCDAPAVTTSTNSAESAPAPVEYTQPRNPRGAVESDSKYRYHTVIEGGKKQ